MNDLVNIYIIYPWEMKKEKSEWEKVKDLERDEEAVKRGALLPKWVLKKEYMVKRNPFT